MRRTFLEPAIVPNNEIGIRWAVLQLSLTSGHRTRVNKRCDCLKKCITNWYVPKCQSVNPKMYRTTQDATVIKPA